ncbi:SusD/RagB family nutrient-binding outer membrane lipoprotein [Niabella yanshanensis]|uniref:SusD/RagB family nutrient-binding outer membrane lipoprotein n=1 Tax=Niabella yanshanensis TaxID=577386 RepID=A0ABZ0W714_9BACT|nr:SusD/RagB family nutrient-binding outer membrane lipoprotein [Niabella yanshanensis]WQD38324.1 SusD/RagB family nutrient-binding outer membrane lipoprotein [Niabella yanshanensis]
MKHKNKLFLVSAVIAVCFTACKKDTYIEYNTNPATIYNIKAEEQFTNGCIAMFDADYEYFYDYYRIMMPWMQYFTPVNGNSKTFMSDVGNFNQRRGYFYSRVGNVFKDVLEIIKLLPQQEQASRQHQVAITNILMTYYAFYATDINGSLPYTEAFQARYGGTVTPKYDTQEALFNKFDADLKASIAALKSNADGQVSFGAADLYYKGDATKWVKAANALRLRLAMRWAKRNAAKQREIATEVLANPADLFASNDDNLEFVTSSSHAGAGSNWDPSGALFKGSKAVVDFMYETSDPRIRIFFQKNAYSATNVARAIAQNVIPASTVVKARQYVGGFASPDAASNPANARYYNNNRNFLNANNRQQPLDTLSRIQYRLFTPALENPVLTAPSAPGTGSLTFPMLTYSELLFFRAELAVKGVTTENASQLYEAAVKASMRYYDVMGSRAQVFEYTAITDAEVNAAYNHDKVKFNTAKAMDQIASQSYLHFFKQANEGWSLYKRTGMPNTTTVLAFEQILADGVAQKMPRRALVNLPLTTDRNFENAKAAIDEMAKDPNFGAGPGDIYGRVWWDMP